MGKLSDPMVVIAMVNGMIGGVILVLPLLALHAGNGFTVIILFFSGMFSFYSCYLCVKHLGQQRDLYTSLLKHFRQSRIVSLIMKHFYDLIVFVNLLFLLVLYFELIVIQWESLLPYSIINPILNGVVLFILVFILKYMEFGASILAYGIISIIGYCIFLIWLLVTAPKGQHNLPNFGSEAVNLAASMGQAFAIQTFFIPVLKQNIKTERYWIFTLIAYVIGFCVYLYIAYAGAYGIVNRIAIIDHPEDVIDYFNRGHWQVMTLNILYLIHLYSAYPQFLIVSIKRVFSLIHMKETPKGKIPFRQGIYTFIFVGVCTGLAIVRVDIDIIIQINGAVIGFFFIYFLPLVMHIKCLYFTKKQPLDTIVEQKMDIELTQRKQPMLQHQNGNQKPNIFMKTTFPQQNSIHMEDSKYETSQDTEKRTNNQPENSESQPSARQPKPRKISQPEQQRSESVKQQMNQVNYDEEMKKYQQQLFTCTAQKPERIIWKIIDGIMLLAMISLGGFIMVNGIYSIIVGDY